MEGGEKLDSLRSKESLLKRKVLYK